MNWVLHSWSGKRAVVLFFCQVGFWSVKSKFVIHKAKPENNSGKAMNSNCTQIKKSYLNGCAHKMNLHMLREAIYRD